MIKKENDVFTAIIIGIIFVLFCTIVGGKAFSSRITAIKDAKTRNPSIANINWEELYPYNTVVDEVEVDNSAPQEETFTSKIAFRILRFNKLGDKWAKIFYGYIGLDKVGYVISSRLIDPSIGDTYIRLNNGYWIKSSSEITTINAQNAIAPYASLNNYLHDEGIEFLYFYAPQKDCDIDDEYPDGITSYANANIDKYLKAMDYYGIYYIHLRQELHYEGMDHYSMFYKTDHHWTVESGLWASSIVEQKVSEKLGIEMVNPYDLGKYNSITYKNAEFGSLGNGVTHYVAESEDFTILYPDFITSYRLEIPNKGIDVTGSFEDIFVDDNALQELVESGGGSAYGRILYGNPPYVKITNLNNPNGPKILMIRDSFSSVVAPYLAASCSELVMLDTRPDNGYFTGSMAQSLFLWDLGFLS